MIITRRKANELASISIDKVIFEKIVDDMDNNAGRLSPLNHWHLVEKKESDIDDGEASEGIVDRYNDNFYEQFSSAEEMMDAWVGSEGLKQLVEEDIKYNEDYLNKVDCLGMLSHIKQTRNKYSYIKSDISTIVQLNALSAIMKTGDIVNPYIIEVGGGYGRLAEAVMNIIEGARYVMLDAVPGSLYYAYKYMKRMLPDKKVGGYYYGDEFDLDKYDVFILPSWHFVELNKYNYDVCINLHSFQEMGQYHVDYYIDLFDSVCKEHGFMFLENARDYVFKGNYNYKNNWKKMCMYNTPAGWTDLFPMEIFEKTSVNCSAWNAQMDAMYAYSLLKIYDEREKAKKLQETVWKLEWIDSECGRLREENKLLKNKMSKLGVIKKYIKERIFLLGRGL